VIAGAVRGRTATGGGTNTGPGAAGNTAGAAGGNTAGFPTEESVGATGGPDALGKHWDMLGRVSMRQNWAQDSHNGQTVMHKCQSLSKR
jgi:hypothetical protein